jgi:phosphoglycolate phosphatase-like HAD superfamily hydrolase
MSTVLFWDIDGTLLATGGAGMFAWNDAVREQTGCDFDLKTTLRSAGFTDYQIGVRTFEVLGIPATDGDVDRLVRRYEELLPASLFRKEGRVLPNVRAILERLAAERPDVRSYLLTGNTAAGARAKLTHYGLWDLLSRGAFCVEATARAGIAARALALARQDGPVGCAIVIGDTPHDIECANAVGARTLAVATGGYALPELLAHRPWHGCEELPGPDAFLALIETIQTTPEPVRRG